MRHNTHKILSDIENDIQNYYSFGVDTELTLLKIAGRAMAAALDHLEPYDRQQSEGIKQGIDALIVGRQNELDRV